jgi:hypothetical protein
MEQGIWLGFVKTSEFPGGGGCLNPAFPPRYATDCMGVFSVRVATWYVVTKIYEFPAILRVKYLLFSCKCLGIEVIDLLR